MEKLLAKIRNKKLKGNVSLLVILILLASSVISLLSINQIQRLMTYGNMTFNYFRAFYLAKAGTELGLTEVYNRGDGFNHHIGSGDAIVSGNLLSGYDGFEPYFDMTITGSFQYLTNDIRESNECGSGNKITLGTGEGLMLSLFYDKTGSDGGLQDILSGNTNIQNFGNYRILELKRTNPWNNEFTFAFFTYDNDNMTNIVVSTGYYNNLGTFLREAEITDGKKGYLTIKNSGSETVEFCINTMGNRLLIPYSNSLITVFGHYGDMEVGLQSVVKKGVPDWTLNVIGQPQN